MKKLIVLILLFCAGCNLNQNNTNNLTINLSITESLRNAFVKTGRIYIFLNKGETPEPRTRTWPTPGSSSVIFAKNISDWDATSSLTLESDGNWSSTEEWNINNIPQGNYYLQVLWDPENKESIINVPGNLYSKPQKIEVNGSLEVTTQLSEKIPERKLVDHPLVKEINFQSDTLSKWWKDNVMIKAAVLLPSGYLENPNKKYPVRYNIGGYGSRYTRVNNLLENEKFKNWWLSEEAPQIINVFLDGEGPFGDSYQLNSENSGPYGYSLINELIPFLEKKFRAIGTPQKRFVDGCSTGGWVSLALQLYYPNTFNGCFSFSPDPVDFHHMQLVDIYEDQNAFFDDNLVKRPSMRTTKGDTIFSIKREITYENVQGYSNTFVTSGNQWGGWNALFSPKGDDGLPMPMFDPVTGKVNREVALKWKKYDLLGYLKGNWYKVGPKVQGKIYIWMGDMDHFYLNEAMVEFKKYLDTTEKPQSDAKIIIEKGKGHCSDYSHRKVLEMINEKLHIQAIFNN